MEPLEQAVPEPEYGSWHAEGSPLTVDYSLAVLELIRAEVIEGYHAFRRGGIEVGGVLFGDRQGHTLRVRDHRRLACEHASGPAFRLSDRDLVTLAGLLAGAQKDPRLAGLRPLGYYFSHTRSDLRLRDHDLAVYDRFFPQRDKVALVLRPLNAGTARATFYCRAADGTVRTALGSEFLVRPRFPTQAGLAPEPAPAEPPAQDKPQAVVIIEPLPLVVEVPRLEPKRPKAPTPPADAPGAAPAPARRALVPLLLLALLAGLTIAGMAWMVGASSQPAAPIKVEAAAPSATDELRRQLQTEHQRVDQLEKTVEELQRQIGGRRRYDDGQRGR